MIKIFKIDVVLHQVQKSCNRIYNNLMEARLIREIREKAIVLGTDKHRNAAFGFCKLAHQLANFLQVDICSNGPYERVIFVPKRIGIRKDTLFRHLVDFRARNGKPLMP